MSSLHISTYDHLIREGGDENEDTPKRPLTLGTRGGSVRYPLTRKPLGMNTMNTNQGNGDQGVSAVNSRLKRLSLVPKPKKENEAISPTTTHRRSSLIEVENKEDICTPRTKRGHMGRGVRSSISYSPSIDRRIGEEGMYHLLREKGEEKGKSENGGRRGETLVEKHADLLTLIAQKERKVNELREELAAHESSLASLKKRWTNLVSFQTPTSQPQIRPLKPQSRSRTRDHPPSSSSNSPHIDQRGMEPESSRASISISSSTSSNLSSFDGSSSDPTSPSNLTSTLEPDLPSIDQSIVSLLSNITSTPIHVPGAEKILNKEAIEGGKRFWDSLVKTVSAAAVGTVPESIWSQETGTRERRRLRPVNSDRLGRGETSLGTGVEERVRGDVDLLSGDEDDVGAKTLTPRRPSVSISEKHAPGSRRDQDKREACDLTDGEESDNGWGWGDIP